MSAVVKRLKVSSLENDQFVIYNIFKDSNEFLQWIKTRVLYCIRSFLLFSNER